MWNFLSTVVGRFENTNAPSLIGAFGDRLRDAGRGGYGNSAQARSKKLEWRFRVDRVAKGRGVQDSLGRPALIFQRSPPEAVKCQEEMLVSLTVSAAETRPERDSAVVLRRVVVNRVE